MIGNKYDQDSLLIAVDETTREWPYEITNENRKTLRTNMYKEVYGMLARESLKVPTKMKDLD